MRRYSFILLSLFITLFTLTLPIQAQSTPIQTQIKQILQTRFHSPFRNQILKLYQLNNFNALWVGSKNATNYSTLIQALDNPIFNYSHKDFNRNKIKQLSFSIDNSNFSEQELPTVRATLDILMSDAFMRLLDFLRVGEVDWSLVQRKLKNLKETQDVQASWDIHPKKTPNPKTLLNVFKQNRLKEYLNRQIPLEHRYRSLISLLQKYRKMPKFPKLSTGRTIRVNDTDSRLPQIKRMLKFFGDYPKSYPEDSEFDLQLAKAIKSFRERFKLPKGTSIDNKVIHYLNMTKAQYLKKIIVNLEKLKLYPHSWESEYIEVNIPEYKMRFYRNGRAIFSSDVVVGRIDRPTPVFDGKMSYIVLNPTWTIPDNLVRRDLIPMLRKNPNYLKEHDIHVYTYKSKTKEVPLDFEKLSSYENDKRAIPYRFVQFPSSNNALGKVKFMFPNKYSVYLHDTDNKRLFAYRYRVFSSGCMRLQRPIEFLQKLLPYAKRSYRWIEIQNILDKNIPTTIRLKRDIPIHIVYFTVRKKGKRDYFFYDIYLHDKIIWESMNGHKKQSFKVPAKRLNPLHKKRKRRRHYPF